MTLLALLKELDQKARHPLPNLLRDQLQWLQYPKNFNLAQATIPVLFGTDINLSWSLPLFGFPQCWDHLRDPCLADHPCRSPLSDRNGGILSLRHLLRPSGVRPFNLYQPPAEHHISIRDTQSDVPFRSSRNLASLPPPITQIQVGHDMSGPPVINDTYRIRIWIRAAGPTSKQKEVYASCGWHSGHHTHHRAWWVILHQPRSNRNFPLGKIVSSETTQKAAFHLLVEISIVKVLFYFLLAVVAWFKKINKIKFSHVK